MEEQNPPAFRRIPEHSIYTVLCGSLDDHGRQSLTDNPFELRRRANGIKRLREIAEWAVRHARCGEEWSQHYVQALLFRFLSEPIGPETPIDQILKAARLTAKRWALEERAAVA
jgi:hypothetical protein